MSQADFEVPEEMKKKRTKEQQEIFIKACSDNRNMKEFVLWGRKLYLDDDDLKVIIHNIVFNTVYLLKN